MVYNSYNELKVSELLLSETCGNFTKIKLREINQTHTKEFRLLGSINIYSKTKQNYHVLL